MSDDTKGTTKGKDAKAEIPADLYFLTVGVYDARTDDYLSMVAGCDLLHTESKILAINEKRVTKALRRVETPLSAQVSLGRESDPIIQVSYTITKPKVKGTADDAAGEGRAWKLEYILDGKTVTESPETEVRQWKYKRDEVQLAVWDKVRHCLSKIYPDLVTIGNVATPEEAAAAAEIAKLQAQLKTQRAALKTMKSERKGA